MSKYLNVFNTLAEYQAFSASTEYVQPNVALVKETNVLYYDYGDNKPQADMSNFKVESQETSVGGSACGKEAITKVNYVSAPYNTLNRTFEGFSHLEEVACELPSNVKEMTYTFSGCKRLIKSPEIPSGVTNMQGTFSDCEELVNSPVIPSGVTNMIATFSECRKLANSPVIPSGVTDLRQTFYHCRNLNKIEIPSGVTSMIETFYNAIIRELTLLPTTPPYYYNTLEYQYGLQTIYVPDSSVEDYKTATGWSKFADMIKPLSEKPSE